MAIDLSHTPPPPVKRQTTKRDSQAKRSSLHDAREEAVNGIGQLVAMVAVLTNQNDDALAVSTHWPNIATAAADTADNSEGLAKVIDYIMVAGPWAALIGASVPLAIQIMVNHGKLPAGPFEKMGVVQPIAGQTNNPEPVDNAA